MEPVADQIRELRQFDRFLPLDNPTFNNRRIGTIRKFRDAGYRVLIVRLSPFRDVDRSIPHLFLFQEVRRALPDAFIDLAFFPATSERAALERAGVAPLIGTQSLRTAEDFDLVLISNAYVLELINLPYLLIRSGIPLFCTQRGPEWPILILGGSNSMATQSIIQEDGDSLVDGIFFGEGEGLVGHVARLLRDDRGADKKKALARAAAQVPGLWVAGAFHTTAKAVCRPQPQFLPTEYPILNSPEVHAANLQINYGCPAFCNFCFEGYDRKPYRELPLSDILAAAGEIKLAQGVEELNLYSFNFNTHSDILEMLLALHQLFDRVSFKSQRLDVLQHTGSLLEAEVEADKREFTLGIEGISERLRTWLHKSLATEDVTGLLERLLGLKVRRVKLFYILTGYETADDMAEFRHFVKWLKEARRSRNRHVRVVFSFGLLVRQPRTPLQYDRLFLDEQDWRPLIGQAKSACETNGFEFRMAFDWPTYCANQVLAMGGYWLLEPLVALAQQGYFFDGTLPAAYWDALKGQIQRAGQWSDTFMGKKDADYPFALEFVETNVSAEFLYNQYREAQAGVDSGYCLGNRADNRASAQVGRCLGCGACVEEQQRRAITQHHVRQPESESYMARLRDVMVRKRRLQPVHVLVRLDPRLGWVLPEFLNALVFREILTRHPELVDNLLAVREDLFALKPNNQRFPMMGGETVFALRAWNTEALEAALARGRHGERPGSEAGSIQILGPAEGFTPGTFARLRLDVYLPGDYFPEPRVRLEEHLRSAYLRYSLRREETALDRGHPGRTTDARTIRYRFDLPKAALKKKILFGGFFEPQTSSGTGTQGGFYASLDVGPKFDLLAFLGSFAGDGHAHHACIQALDIRW